MQIGLPIVTRQEGVQGDERPRQNLLFFTVAVGGQKGYLNYRLSKADTFMVEKGKNSYL